MGNVRNAAKPSEHRLYLRAGSRRGHRGLRPGGKAEIKAKGIEGGLNGKR